MTTNFISILLSSSFIVRIDAALNLQLNLFNYKDPKEVSWKIDAPRYVTTANACPSVNLDDLAAKGFLKAQDGEDKCLIHHYFEGICNGKYLDIGAHNGMTISNSYAFYITPELHWRGVNIELDPENYQHLVSNRPDDIANVHAAVCNDQQMLHYASATNKAVGGIWEFSSESHRNQWWKGMTMRDTIPIQCTPTQNVLDQTLGTGNTFFFDFLTLDIEGAELSALLGIDFDKIGFGIILVEKNARDDVNRQVTDLLRSKGYDRIDEKEKQCGFRNVWYINRKFDEIYKSLRVPAVRSQLRRR